VNTSLSLKLQNINFLSGIFLRKPLVFFRLMSGYARSRLMNQRRLRFMDIALDYKCNMNCTHCSAANLKSADKEPFTLAEFSRIADDLYHEGCLIFHFTGGEPILRSDLEDFIRAAKPERSIISIQSNGLLATRERLTSLREAGADIFNISIDSGIPEENDKFRNLKGAFERSFAAVDIARELGYSVSVSTCISHNNINSEGLKRIIAYTAERKVWCYFNLAVPIGNWKNLSEYILSVDDQRRWRQIVEDNPHCRIDLKSNWYRVGCGAVKEKGYLTAYGDFMTCPFIHVSLGNLREEPISKIRARALRVPEFADYYPCCLAAENLDFIKKTPCYTDWQGVSPVPYRDIPWMCEHMES
jgi:MoaA/NifB/PqqE/SkfB family radical SAM enzyme